MRTHPVDDIKALLKTMTQAEVGKKLGIHPSLVSYIVSGKRFPGDKVLKALGMRVRYERVK
jgi:transcriptional regulator with XRE-family HTH domain